MKIKYLFITVMIFFLLTNQSKGQEIQKMRINELEHYIASSNKPLIINFWATFCKPCLEEIPYFISKAEAHIEDSVELLLVSLDMEDFYPGKIASFARARKITAPIAWLNETDADIFCPVIDPKWSGAIPATLFVNNSKGYRKFFEDQLSETALENEVMELIKK